MLPGTPFEGRLPRYEPFGSPSSGAEDPSQNEVSTVSSLASQFGLRPTPTPSEESGNDRGAAEIPKVTSGQQERMEIEDRAHGFRTPKQNIKNLIHSYRIFSSRTRQTLLIGGITVASLLAILAVFYIAKFSQQTSNGEAVVFEHTMEERVEVSIKDNLDQTPSPITEEFGTTRGVKVVKSKHGKAKQYELLSKNPSIATEASPILSVSSVNDTLDYSSEVNETDVDDVLGVLRKTVDLDRKKISSKELRFWEHGASQLRVLLVSTWGTGAGYLSRMLQAHPGVFQHFEPLSYIGLRQVRSGREAFEAQQVVHRLLDCKYEAFSDYMNYTREHVQEAIGPNDRVWESCLEESSPRTCADERFLSSACKLFPIQLVKTIRLRLNLTQLLLNDQKLNVKVLFVVRDPRGIMSERSNSVEWCSSSPDCSSPEALCQDMQGDLKVASVFEKLYPERFMKIKYEDFLENTHKAAASMFSFLHLEFSDMIQSFLREEPIERYNSPSATPKVQDRVMAWKKTLPLPLISTIQNNCGAVLKELKYDTVRV